MKCLIGVRNVFFAYAVCLLIVGCVTLPEIPDIEIPGTKPDDKPADLAETTDAIDIKAIKWLGDNHSGAQQTMVLQSATISAKQVTYSPAAPSNWPKKTVKKLVQARTCVFYERNGITGGFYEWSKPNDTVRPTHNLTIAYQGHSMPARNGKVWIMLVSVDGKQRSNIIQANWK